VRVEPGQVCGSVTAPPSKSVTIRALFAAALARGTSTIFAPSRCEDAEAAVRAVRARGVELAPAGDAMLVRGPIGPGSATLQCGESALCMRMLAPIAALQAGREVTLLATGSLLHRSMAMLEAPLRALGAQCTTEQGRPPVRVRGPLSGGRARLDASGTSQGLTGLLFALPLCPRDSELQVPALASGRYVELTLQVLERFGIRTEHDAGLRNFRIPGGQQFTAQQFTVEGDWSAAAFLLVAGASAGHVEVAGLRQDSLQADAGVLEALGQCGAMVACAGAVRVTSGALHAFHCDVSDRPDLLPPLCVLACSCPGTSELSGIERARLKESDRVAALAEELARLGAAIQVEPGRMLVTGSALHGGTVDCRGDHRIAMALAVAALRASGPVEILGAGSVAKSYPRFFDELKVLRK
jgi:3-phosphoshikimate 1-carboxyvinyltransferase